MLDVADGTAAWRLLRPGARVDVLGRQLAPGMEVIGKPFALGALSARVRAMLEAAPVQ